MVDSRTASLRLVDPNPEPLPGPISLDVPPEDGSSPVSLHDGVLSVEQPDGSVTVDFNPDLSDPDKEGSSDHFANLANKIDDGELSAIAAELLDGIQRDEDSRKEWMTTRARGITLLGLRLEDPQGGSGEATSPVEGTSRVHHPLLLEATIRFQATARAELLPATGPVKIRNDTIPHPKPAPNLQLPPNPPPSQEQDLGMVPAGMSPPRPPPLDGHESTVGAEGGAMPIPSMMPAMGHNGGPPMEESSDDLAEALEKDMNHYLTVTAKEYIPDTDRMLFYIGFGGDGFKKVFNCPLRRRPVSESVDAEDLIVSNAATALSNCGRITHKIKMRKSVLKRMQIIGAYRDVEIGAPATMQPTVVEAKKAEVEGQKLQMTRPEDQDYTIYETYCELELDQFAPEGLKGQGLPLPYRVTIERDSRQVLSIIRNWDEDDDQALPKQFFVQFPFVRGLGFYGLGFIHILGNTTVALTALWRELIDAGMFSNFPGFLYLKSLGRQLTNQFRVPPGGGIALDAPPNTRIQDAIMPVPYKEPGAGFMGIVKMVEEAGTRLGMTTEINVGEGKQDAPVGTTLALIEQATKVMDSAHKRLHAAQAEEFMLLKERFKEDPEAFWRHNRRPSKPWTKDQFLHAIEDNDLVPVADPNNPTSLHRIAKAAAVKQLQTQSPNLYNPKSVDERVMRIMGIDAEGLFNEQPAPDKPDPRLVAIQAKAEASKMQSNLGMAQERMRFMVENMKLSDRGQERSSRERIAQAKQRLEETRMMIEQVRDSDTWNAENASRIQKMYDEQMAHARDIEADHIKHIRELGDNRVTAQHEMALAQAGQEQEQDHAQEDHSFELEKARRKHEQDMEHQRQSHELKKQHESEMHQVRLANAKALANARKTSKST